MLVKQETVSSKNAIPRYRLSVKIKAAKSGRKVAIVRILGEGTIKWRRVSASPEISNGELHELAIQTGKKHCRGAVVFQGYLPGL